jgi:hypothetical protein
MLLCLLTENDDTLVYVCVCVQKVMVQLQNIHGIW